MCGHSKPCQTMPLIFLPLQAGADEGYTISFRFLFLFFFLLIFLPYAVSRIERTSKYNKNPLSISYCGNRVFKPSRSTGTFISISFSLQMLPMLRQQKRFKKIQGKSKNIVSYCINECEMKKFYGLYAAGPLSSPD